MPDSMLSTAPRGIRDTTPQDSPIDTARRTRHSRRRFAAVTGIGFAVLVVAAWQTRMWLSTTPVIARESIRTANVTRGLFERDAQAQGTVIAAVSPTVFAPATGSITFHVKAGEAVKKDQILGEVESPALMNEYARELATLHSLDVALRRQEIEIRRQRLQNRQASDLAGVQIHAAGRELKRAENAWQLHIIPEHDYQRAVDDLETARLTYRQALANAHLQSESLDFELTAKHLDRDRQQLVAENLKRRVNDLTLRSPVDGLIGNLAVNQNATVAENAPLLTVVDLSALEIEFKVPESYAGAIGLDMPAEVTYGATIYPGRVTAISPEVQQSEVTGRVRFGNEIPAGLRQNQRLNLRIVMESRSNVLKVERGAFVDAGGGAAYVVDNDNAVRRPIKIGAMSIGSVEIIAGLAAGEKIIVSDMGPLHGAPSVRIK